MGNPRILVVDDEENFLRLLAKTLGKEGYEVKTASDGEEALRWLEEGPLDLVLIDIKMAPMDGLSLLEKVKRRSPRTKVIMITAYPTPKNRLVSFREGASEYLIKPVDMDELKETIRTTLLHDEK